MYKSIRFSSQSLPELFILSASGTGTWAFGWTPMGDVRRRGKPRFCALEITTAATGAWAPLGEVQNECPGGQQLPGESQLPVRAKT